MSTQIKICGVTSVADALSAAEAGADMIGLMFYDQSPRHVSLPVAAEIARALPSLVLRVGVFVNPTEGFVRQAIAECGLGLLQFHGNETSAFCTRFGVMNVKAIRIRDESSLSVLADYRTDAFLLDAHSAAALGGTGEKFNWDLALEAKKAGKPIILAGGLTPENVAAAVTYVHPLAVDVSSGVESAPGKKDPDKVRAFIKAAKSVV
jgi:phosphoribosylanthranilate isomerase